MIIALFVLLIKARDTKKEANLKVDNIEILLKFYDENIDAEITQALLSANNNNSNICIAMAYFTSDKLLNNITKSIYLTVGAFIRVYFKIMYS